MSTTTTMINPTSLEAVLEQNANAVAAYVAQWNQTLKANYLDSFDAYAASVMAGRSDPANAPKPPMAWEVGYMAVDPAVGPKWAYPLTGTTPVCDMPPVPTPPPPYVPPVLPEPDDVRNVPAGDTLPVGYVLTAPDGSRWQKHSSHTPFGVSFYYVRLS